MKHFFAAHNSIKTTARALFVALFVALGLSSCNNVSGGSPVVFIPPVIQPANPATPATAAPVANEQRATVTFCGSIGVGNALPQEVSAKVSALEASLGAVAGVSKAAQPDLEIGKEAEYYYYVSATPQDSVGNDPVEYGRNDNGEGGKFSGGSNGISYAIPLKVGKWIIECGIKNSQNKPVLKASSGLITLDESQSVVSRTFSAAPVSVSDAGNGSVLLTFNRGTADVDSAIARWKDSSGTEQSKTLERVIEGDPAAWAGVLTLDLPSVAPGAYEMTISFYNNSDPSAANRTMVFQTVQTVSVFSGMKTNKWVTNGYTTDKETGLISDDGFFIISSAAVNVFRSSFLYVGDTGSTAPGYRGPSDSNEGSFLAPFATLQKAFNTIEAAGSGEVDYTIYVCGTDASPLKGNAVLRELLGDPSNKKAKSILITNVDGSTHAVIAGGGADGDLNVISVLTDVPVKIRGVKITRDPANTTSRGININKAGASVTLLSGTEIRGHASGTGYAGAGVHVEAGSLRIKGAKITDNHSQKNAGGVYVSNVGSATMESGEISSNSAPYGGGVSVESNNGSKGSFEMTGGTISGNTATSADGGGAVYVNGEFKISGNASIPYGGSVKSNDVALKDQNQQVIVDGSFYSSGKVATITPTIKTRGTPVLKKGSGEINADDCGRFGISSLGFNIKKSKQAGHLDLGVLSAPIYVSEGANAEDGDNDEGTQTHPFKTLQYAVSKLSGGEPDTIFIDGTLEAKQTIPNTFIADNCSALTIMGAGNLENGQIKDKKNPVDAIAIPSTSSAGSALEIQTSVPITIMNLKITGGNATASVPNAYGGGIYLNSGGDVTLSDAALVTKNNAIIGGGVYVCSGAKLYLNGSAVIGDNGNLSAAATGSTAGANKSGDGAGIYNSGSVFLGYERGSDGSPKEAQLTGGVIGNYAEATSPKGAGISNSNMGVLKIASGKVSYNGVNVTGSADGKQGGGGVYNNGTVEMTGGEIVGNEASGTRCYGGGVLISKQLNMSGTPNFTMTGGTISGNKAVGDNGYGGAVCEDVWDTDISFTMGGTASIPYGGTVKNNDVYLVSSNTTAATITIASAGFAENAPNTVATITLAKWKRKTNFLISTSSNVITGDHTKRFNFTNDNDGWERVIKSTNQKSAYIDSPIYVVDANDPDNKTDTNLPKRTRPEGFNKGKTSGATGTKTNPYATIAAALGCDDLTIAGRTITVAGTLGAQTIASGTSVSGGTSSPVTITGYKTTGATSSTAKIDGSGYSASSTRSMLTVDKEGLSVTIQDLKITGGMNAAGGGICVSAGTVSLESGAKVTGNKAKFSMSSPKGGAGVYVASGATLNIKDGAEIYGNTGVANSSGGIEQFYGGGVCNNGTVDMSGGHIYKNYAYYGGGIYNGTGATLYVRGSALIGDTTAATSGDDETKCSNRAGNSGGGIENNGIIYLGCDADGNASSGYTLNDGCGVRGNAAGWGGGICSMSGTVKAASGHVSYNYAHRGGGIYIYDNSGTYEMGALAMTENQATECGGAVFIYSGTLTINGAASLTKNLVTGREVEVGEESQVGKGGAVCLNGSSSYLVMKAGTIGGSSAENKATGDDGLGGAIYCNGGTITLSGTASIPAGSAAKINDVYITGSLGRIKLDSDLSSHASNKQIAITPDSSILTRGRTVLGKGSATGAPAITDEIAAKFKTTDDEWSVISYSNEGKIDADYWVSEAAMGTAANGYSAGDDTNGNGTKKKPYATIQKAAKATWRAAEATINVSGTLTATGTGTSEGKGNLQNIPYSGVTATSIKLVGTNSAKINAASQGSAFTVNKAFAVTISGIEITGGKADAGGGINIAAAATVNLGSGAKVYSNKANSGKKGAGVYVPSGATLYVKNGSSIYSNSAYSGTISGGGIYNDGTVEVESGSSIYSNSAANGGGIYNAYSLTLSGGTIGSTANTATTAGGAIYNAGTLKITGAVSIPCAATPAEKTNDIALDYASSAYKSITASAAPSGTVAITPTGWHRGKLVVSAQAASFAPTDADFTVLASSGNVGKLDSEAIYVAATTAVTGYGAGKTPANGGRGSKNYPYSTISDAVAQCWNGPNDTKTTGSGDDTVVIGREIKIIGTISGAQEIASGIGTSVASAITLAGVSGTTPTLNGGYSATSSTKKSTLTLATPLPVTIKSLKITGGYTENNGGGINKTSAAATAILTIGEDAVITQNTALKSGGGIYCNGGKLIMTGGEVSSNSAGTISGTTPSGYGGGISAGTFDLSAGTIKENTVTAGGGGVSACDMTMTGGTISDNTVSTTNTGDGYGGGGVIIWESKTFDMSGGHISGNVSHSNGGGVLLYDATFLMHGSAVIGDEEADVPADVDDNWSNYAYGDGGGICAQIDSDVGIGYSDMLNYTNNNRDINFTGGIYYNLAAGDGGGIYKWNTLLKIGYGSVKYNGAKNGGGVYARGGLIMTGGHIDCNCATDTTDDTCGGGGIYSLGDVSMFGSTNYSTYWPYIKNNEAKKNGGGLYLSGASLSGASLYLGGKAVIGYDLYANYAQSQSSASNYAGGNGGGVYITGSGSVNVGYASADDKASGTLAADNGYISDNYAAGNGGGVYNASNNPIYIAKGMVQYNAGQDGGGIYSPGKNVVMSGGSVYYNHAANEGGGIYTCATVDMTGGTINKNSADNNGGGVCLMYDSTLATAPKIYMTGNALIGDTSSGAAKSGAANCGNYAKNGGGIWGKMAHVVMGYNSAGTAVGTQSKNRIRKNFATVQGGGIYMTGGNPNICELKMRYANVDYNAVDNGDEASCSGGGMYLSECNVLIEIGSSISYNEANYSKGSGGGIYYAGTKTTPAFSMTGGSINNNQAYSSGGIRQSSKATIEVTGGEIKYNQAADVGGGIYVFGPVILKGPITFTDNKSTVTKKGGAAVIIGGCTLTLGSSINIVGTNTAGYNDINLGAGGPKLNLDGNLSGIGSNKYIYLTPNNYSTSIQYVYGTLSNYTKFKVFADTSTGKNYSLGSAGMLVEN